MSLTSRILNEAYASESKPAGLVGYILHRERGLWLPPQQGGMFDYLLTADGVYLHAKREELEVSFPLLPGVSGVIRGLQPTMPVFDFELPLVPEGLIAELWAQAEDWANQGLETLFHLVWSPVYPWNNGWGLDTPEQERSATRCKPLHDGPGSSHEKAIVEIHSHHLMPARFSPTDDKDETGFRLYGVIGRLPEAPEIRLRVGVYGYFWEIPASWALELPECLRDCNAEDWDG